MADSNPAPSVGMMQEDLCLADLTLRSSPACDVLLCGNDGEMEHLRLLETVSRRTQ